MYDKYIAGLYHVEYKIQIKISYSKIPALVGLPRFTDSNSGLMFQWLITCEFKDNLYVNCKTVEPSFFSFR